jgi:hypothetical protein
MSLNSIAPSLVGPLINTRFTGSKGVVVIQFSGYEKELLADTLSIRNDPMTKSLASQSKFTGLIRQWMQSVKGYISSF